MAMDLRHRHPSKNRTNQLDIESPEFSPSLPQRRWRLACKVVYFTVALPKKHIHKDTQFIERIVARTLSYVSIEISSDIDETSVHNDAIVESPPSSPLSFVDQNTLTSMTKSKDLEALSQLGGAQHLASILRAKDNIIGVSSNNTEHILNQKRAFLSFVIQAFKGIPTLAQLLFAVFSLGFGIKLYGKKQGWYDGGGIFISVFLTLVFSATIKFKHSQVVDQLSHKIGNIQLVRALRDGCPQLISISEIVVGDVILLKIGDYIPADGLLLDGFSLKVISLCKNDQVDVIVNEDAPFLLSGSKVVDGYGKMLVTSVLENITTFQNMGNEVDQLSSHQPLQTRIENLNFYITTLGLIVAFLHLVVLELRYFTGATKDQNGNQAFKGREMKTSDVVCVVVKHISGAITIAVASIPEGLPLAVMLALSCSMKMMSSLDILMQLARWENIGSISVICTDKTGILTVGEMVVSEFWVGKDKVEKPFKNKLTDGLDQLLQENIGLNTNGGVTGACYEPASESMPQIYGSPVEKAIQKWGIAELGINMEGLNTGFEVLKVKAYNQERKRSGVMARRKRDHRVQVHFKGPAKVLLANCSDYYNRQGELITMGDEKKKTFNGIINKMGENSSLTYIAFACKQIDQADLNRNKKQLDETGLSLIAILGLKDQYRPGIAEAVESCNSAQVSVKLITGDDITTAKAIAREIGIFNEIGNPEPEAVIEGTEFRNYSPEQRLEKVDKIQVMASASPSDKLLMVQNLKQKGHVVALMDDGTNSNASALEEADIGLIMVTESTQVIAKGSDIVVLDGNFCSIVTILRWGRCLFSNIRKVIQVQLTITAVGCISSSIIAATSGTVPLLWVNMMVDTLAALALATEKPIGKDDDLMKKEPLRKADQLIIVTNAIWRNIIGQTVYQVIVLLTIQYKGNSIFGVDDGVRNTLIFNCFVFLQVFNECNARRLEKKNIFEGMFENKLFWGIIGFTIALQVIMVELLCKFSNTERLNGGQWAACIAVAALCLPVGWLVKCIPVKASEG